jgi:hypothetical protein
MAIALVIAGFGLVRLTAQRPAAATLPPPPPATASGTVEGSFHLLLSAPAAELLVSTGRDEWKGAAVADATAGGLLKFDKANPQISLIVRWAGPAETGGHRFAKLTLELPGKPTITHVFDSPGDLDEFLELPLL